MRDFVSPIVTIGLIMKACICHGSGKCLGCQIRVLVRRYHGCGGMAWLEAIYESAEKCQVDVKLKPHRDPLDSDCLPESSDKIVDDEI